MAVLGKLVVGLGGLGSLGAGLMYASSVSSDKKAVVQVQTSQKIAQTIPGVKKENTTVPQYAFEDWPHITKWDYNWDRRDPAHMVQASKGGVDDDRFKSEVVANKPKVTRHLFLIRHGQYNLDGRTDKERVLTEKGVEQAKITGKRLAALNFPYQLLARSTMTRAQQTADHILDQIKPLPVQDDRMLEEGAPCPPEPPNFGYSPSSHEYFQDGSRIEAAFRNYVHRADVSQTTDSYEIIVCHGNVIRYFVCRALQLPPEAWLRIDLRHASITWLCVAPSGVVFLRGLGDSGHLPSELVT